MRGQFWCKFGFCSNQNVWVMRVYGLREVWVKRGSTVCPKAKVLSSAVSNSNNDFFLSNISAAAVSPGVVLSSPYAC